MKKLISRLARPFNLTARQVETLALLATGETYKSAADKMEISRMGIYFHVSAILRKTKSQNTVEAVAKIFCAQYSAKN